MLRDAREKGAEVVVGGYAEHEMGANFFPPALLTGCTPDMRISEEEIFGPIVGVTKFSDDDEALAIANRRVHFFGRSSCSTDQSFFLRREVKVTYITLVNSLC